MDNYYSPLRYPGGKAKVANYFKEIFKENYLYDGTYIEPFSGGASVALSLLFNEYASKIIINDIDRSIYSFWYCVLNHTEELCKLIRDTPVTMETWNAQKKIQDSKNKYGLLKVGFSTFFLNRTNRSGIINAGVIGGRNQNGNWKIDARYNKIDLIERITRIARYKGQIELFNLDAVYLVKKLSSKLPVKSIFYFDPPYYVKGKDLYLNYFVDKDHAKIANTIGSIRTHKWVVSYDSDPAIVNLYRKYRQENYFLNYSLINASRGEEIMIFSDNLHIPDRPILALH
jgi:DNA adenine methylase